jgi:hypothetical protein
MSGIGIDFGVNGFQVNPALIAKDVAKMLGNNASAITMAFNTASADGHFHIDVNPRAIMGDTGNFDTVISTVNHATGEKIVGSFEFLNGYV